MGREVSRKPFDDLKAKFIRENPNLTEPELNRKLREKLESDYIAAGPGKYIHLSDEHLQRVLMLMDVFGLSKRDVVDASGLSVQTLYLLISGKTRRGIRRQRCRELGIGEDDYVWLCKRRNKLRRRIRKKIKRAQLDK